MSVLLRPGGFISSEAHGKLSRDQVTLESATATYVPGTVLGQVTSPTLTVAAHGANTGNATIASNGVNGTPIAGNVLTATNTDATHFAVTDQSGNAVGTGVFGTKFVGGGVSFTITAGGTPCAAGDYFTITVPSNYGQFTPLTPAASDGTQTPAGILHGSHTLAGATQQATAITRYAEVKSPQITWPANATPLQIAAWTAQLATLGIILRSAL